MRKKRIIISIVVVICVLVSIFFIMRFGIVGKIYNFIQDNAKEEGPEELKYETFLDKDGNEYVVEYRKVIGFDKEGNEVEAWVDTADPIIIYSYMYKGKIEKIEDNKIYFIVDKEDKSDHGFSFKNVEDYEIVFDIDTYNLKLDPYDTSYGFCDSLSFSGEDFWNSTEEFYSANELEFLVGKYLRVQDSIVEDSHIGERYKSLYFSLRW